MPSKSTIRPEEKTVLLISADEAKEKISEQIGKGNKLIESDIKNKEELKQLRDEWRIWRDYTSGLLKKIFSTLEMATEFNGYSMGGFGIVSPVSLEREIEDFRSGLHSGLVRLKSIQERLSLFTVAPTKHPEASINSIEIIERIAVRFSVVARQLRQRHAGRKTLDVSDEYDVQDLFHALLKLFFEDVREEEPTPSHAGGGSRMDFVLKTEQIVIEIKKARQGLDARELGDQLIIDIGRYKSHVDCRTLVCFVYDPEGWIKNPSGIENDLTRNHDGMNVKVIISPK